MKIKYWGKEWEKGLTLTAELFDREGQPVFIGLPMTETVVGTSAIYKTEDIFENNDLIDPGIYVSRIVDSTGTFLGYDEVIFDGVKEISLLDLKFLTDTELMQLRDALGLDGDKMVARDGQLQKKSEAPYNDDIDTKSL